MKLRLGKKKPAPETTAETTARDVKHPSREVVEGYRQEFDNLYKGKGVPELEIMIRYGDEAHALVENYLTLIKDNFGLGAIIQETGLSRALREAPADVSSGFKRVVSAPSNLFSNMLGEASEIYVGLRLNGRSSDEAFSEAITPIQSLAELAGKNDASAAQHPFYSRLKGYLEETVAGLRAPQITAPVESVKPRTEEETLVGMVKNPVDRYLSSVQGGSKVRISDVDREKFRGEFYGLYKQTIGRAIPGLAEDLASGFYSRDSKLSQLGRYIPQFFRWLNERPDEEGNLPRRPRLGEMKLSPEQIEDAVRTALAEAEKQALGSYAEQRANGLTEAQAYETAVQPTLTLIDLVRAHHERPGGGETHHYLRIAGKPVLRISIRQPAINYYVRSVVDGREMRVTVNNHPIYSGVRDAIGATPPLQIVAAPRNYALGQGK